MLSVVVLLRHLIEMSPFFRRKKHKSGGALQGHFPEQNRQPELQPTERELPPETLTSNKLTTDKKTSSLSSINQLAPTQVTTSSRLSQNGTLKQGNRAAHIRHQCRKTTVLSCHRCLINTGVKKMNYILI